MGVYSISGTLCYKYCTCSTPNGGQRYIVKKIMFTSPGTIAFEIGPLQIHWYGLIIGVGIVCAYWYAIRESVRRGFSSKIVEDLLLIVVPAGVIGARLYYVLFNLSYYGENPVEILQLWKGGLAIHGALLGGAAAFFIYVAFKKIKALALLDIVLPGVLLAQGIGRWGNFFNNEAFGGPTDLLWKLFVPSGFRPEGFENFEFFHPTFLYESLWNFAGVILLIVVSRKLYPGKRPSGLVCGAYLMWYSLGRFFIEGLRLDSLYVGGLRTAQLMSVLLFLSGALLLRVLLRRSTRRL